MENQESSLHAYQLEEQNQPDKNILEENLLGWLICYHLGSQLHDGEAERLVADWFKRWMPQLGTEGPKDASKAPNLQFTPAP